MVYLVIALYSAWEQDI